MRSPTLMKKPRILVKAGVRLMAIAAFALLIAVAPGAFAQPKDVDEVDPNGSVARLAPAKSAVTSKPALPPKWAFGVLFASYRNQADLLDAMQRLRKDYCGDLLWIDSSWLGRLRSRGPLHLFSIRYQPVLRCEGDDFHAARKSFSFRRVGNFISIKASRTLINRGRAITFSITDQQGGAERL